MRKWRKRVTYGLQLPIKRRGRRRESRRLDVTMYLSITLGPRAGQAFLRKFPSRLRIHDQLELRHLVQRPICSALNLCGDPIDSCLASARLWSTNSPVAAFVPHSPDNKPDIAFTANQHVSRQPCLRVRPLEQCHQGSPRSYLDPQQQSSFEARPGSAELGLHLLRRPRRSDSSPNTPHSRIPHGEHRRRRRGANYSGKCRVKASLAGLEVLAQRASPWQDEDGQQADTTGDH